MSLKWLAMGALVVLVGCGQTGRSIGAGDDEAFEEGGEVATTETEEAEDEPELDQTEPGCDVDGDGFEAIACGGTDCRDDDASIRPNQFESCDFIDNNCDESLNEGLNCTVYAHTATELFAIDPFDGSIAYVGAVPGIVDFDTDLQGTLYGISATLLYRLNITTGEWITVGDLGEPEGFPNGFAINSLGQAYATSGSYLYRINLETAVTELVGEVGEDVWSSGDCVVTKADKLYMTSSDSSTPGDDLFFVDGGTGVGELVGNTGTGQIYGLTSAWGYMFGFTSSGLVVMIDEASGEATELHRFSEHAWYGAASSPVR